MKRYVYYYLSMADIVSKHHKITYETYQKSFDFMIQYDIIKVSKVINNI